jgi:hypothetical protein
MLKKTITFTDYNGVQRTEDFWFNLNKAELAKLALSRRGGLDEYLKQIVASNDAGEILEMFQAIIAVSVGRRFEDGRRFEKSREITDDFMQTEAYPALFMEMVTNADAAAEFVRGIVPSDMVDKIDAPQDKEYTDEELLSMSDAEFARIAGTDPKHMSKHHLMIAFQRREHHKATA